MYDKWFSSLLPSITITSSCFPVPSICFRDPVNDWFESLAQCLHWNVRKRQSHLSSEEEEFWTHSQLSQHYYWTHVLFNRLLTVYLIKNKPVSFHPIYNIIFCLKKKKTILRTIKTFCIVIFFPRTFWVCVILIILSTVIVFIIVWQ